MKRILLTTMLIVATLAMTGCATSGKKSNTNVSSEAERVRLLQSFQPVTFGTKATGYTVQCQWLPGDYNQVAIYNGHNAPGLSRATQQAMIIQMADNNCNVMYRQVTDARGQQVRTADGANVVVSPVTILNDAVAQEDMMRVMARTVVPAILNGTGAVALRDALGNNCGQGGCAPTFNVISQAMNQNSSQNELGADISVGTDSCPTGQCESAGPPEE